MDEAVNSSVISQLFTRGRHRNLSVILLLQNMFPKGIFNTNISRNAQYMVLFRSPSDRKQMDIVAERIFATNRPNFMRAYAKETEKPFGYIILDNHPRTTSQKQVVADVFGDCYAYPHITSSPSPSTPLPQNIATPKVIEQSKPTAKQTKRKAEGEKLPAEKQKTTKPTNQTKVKPKPAKTQSKTKQQAKKPKKLPKKQSKPKAKKPRKPKIYKPRFIRSPPRESSEEEQFNSEEEPRVLMSELNALARQQKTGFGPKYVYE